MHLPPLEESLLIKCLVVAALTKQNTVAFSVSSENLVATHNTRNRKQYSITVNHYPGIYIK